MPGLASTSSSGAASEDSSGPGHDDFAAALHVLPDILHYDRAMPATYPNGRVPTDDVYSMRIAWLTNAEVAPSGLEAHDDLLNEFPYLGPPNPPKTSS